MRRSSWGYGRLAAVAIGVAASALFGTPASAHVEVSADKAQAGATNVTVTFTGEAESSKAGIASEQIVLPPGISPANVSLAKAPAGWAFGRTADGFTVGGRALPIGTDAVFSIKITQLPYGVTELPFKTLEKYSDGDIDRWIEIPVAGKPEPANPAPVLKVKPAPSPPPSTVAPSPTPTPADSPTPSAVITTAAASTTAPGLTPTAASDDSGSSFWLWILIAAAAAVVGAIVTGVVRRRRATPHP